MTSYPIHKIDYINLEGQWLEEKSDLMPIIDGVMSSGVFVGGPHIEEFEQKAAQACGTKFCVSLNSGTDALVCAMVALGVRRGDEIITPPNSFIASTAAIVHIGAIPIFVDVLPDQSIDPDLIESAITNRSKAIMPVHLTGRMAKMDRIMEIAEKHNLAVLEDAAQSIGSLYKNRLSGSYGHIGCFSTHPLKNLNACGDGGFVVTNNEALAKKIRSMRNHGLVDRNTVEIFGYVSRMDALQAAILTYRLDRLASVIRRRRANTVLYRHFLDPAHVYVPEETEDYFNTFHTFVIQVDQRDELQSWLAENGIQTAIHYPIPIHLQPAAKKLGYKTGDFRMAEEQAGRILTLPVNQLLQPAQIRYISEAINAFYGA